MLDSSWNVMAQIDAREGKWRGNGRMQWVASTLHTISEHGVSSITTADAHTSAVPAVDWTDTPSAELNGLVRLAERRNLVSARVPSHFNWPLHPNCPYCLCVANLYKGPKGLYTNDAYWHIVRYIQVLLAYCTVYTGLIGILYGIYGSYWHIVRYTQVLLAYCTIYTGLIGILYGIHRSYWHIVRYIRVLLAYCTVYTGHMLSAVCMQPQARFCWHWRQLS
jgi:hypothetical protein